MGTLPELRGPQHTWAQEPASAPKRPVGIVTSCPELRRSTIGHVCCQGALGEVARKAGVRGPRLPLLWPWWRDLVPVLAPPLQAKLILILPAFSY